MTARRVCSSTPASTIRCVRTGHHRRFNTLDRESLSNANMEFIWIARRPRARYPSSAHHGNPFETNHPQDGVMLKNIVTGLLDIAYDEQGDPNGWPVVLLHGFPYDIHTYDDVTPRLTAQGARVLTPYLRGYGSTRF